MQPVDAPRGRGYYIANDLYWGQPKRDGNRLVVIAAPERVFYQSRSTRLREAPTPEIDAGLRETARMIGPFVLDGELYYRDANFGEHRSYISPYFISGGRRAVPILKFEALEGDCYYNRIKEDLQALNLDAEDIIDFSFDKEQVRSSDGVSD